LSRLPWAWGRRRPRWPLVIGSADGTNHGCTSRFPAASQAIASTVGSSLFLPRHTEIELPLDSCTAKPGSGTGCGGEGFRPGASWFLPAKRACSGRFGVGTIDQALLECSRFDTVSSAFLAWGKVRQCSTKLHSYDLFTGTLIDGLIEILVRLRCSVFILSATLTQARRQTLLRSRRVAETMAYPLVTAVWRRLGAEGASLRSPHPRAAAPCVTSQPT